MPPRHSGADPVSLIRHLLIIIIHLFFSQWDAPVVSLSVHVIGFIILFHTFINIIYFGRFLVETWSTAFFSQSLQFSLPCICIMRRKGEERHRWFLNFVACFIEWTILRLDFVLFTSIHFADICCHFNVSTFLGIYNLFICSYFIQYILQLFVSSTF